MKNKNVGNKVAVSSSVPLIGSKADVRGNAKRKSLKQVAREIQQYFAVGGTPQQFECDTKFVAAKIREAIKADREACAEIAENFAKECGEPDGIIIAAKIRKRKTI